MGVGIIDSLITIAREAFMLKQIAAGIVLLVGLGTSYVWADEALNKALLDYDTYRDIAKVRNLISRGADVNAKTSDGQTPLHFAVHYGSKEVVELLVAKGADVNAIAKGSYRQTPLHEAGANKKAAEVLISEGAYVNIKDGIGQTPLHHAANVFVFRGNEEVEVVELLISKGADVNAKQDYGRSPLHLAAWGNRTKTAELLISNGADLDTKDKGGKSPLDYAKEKNNEVVALLQVALRKQEEMAALLQAAVQNQAGDQRETFNRVMANYKDRIMSDDIRHPFVVLSAKLKPAPAVPEVARKYLVRGNALLQDAKKPGEARVAIQEYRNALLAAPWWGDAYFNLSKAQELAGDFDSAVTSMQYYLLTEPQDKQEAQDRLYAIEAKRDKAGRK